MIYKSMEKFLILTSSGGHETMMHGIMTDGGKTVPTNRGHRNVRKTSTMEHPSEVASTKRYEYKHSS